MYIDELTEKEKDELAIDCGYTEDRRVDKIKVGIGRSKYDKNKEHSMHRKIEKALFDKMLFGKEIPQDVIDEFLKYYDDIESIKAESSLS